MKALTVGEFAREAGVNQETVRYYERRRLLPKPARSDSGYRQYHEADLLRLRFIKRAQALGFTLDQIKDLMSLRVDGRSSCAKVQHLAEQKIEEVQEKIRDLERIKCSLAELLDACRNDTRTSSCPVLETLAGEEGNHAES